MKRNTVIAAVVAFGMGGFVGAFTLLAPSLPEHSRPSGASNQPVWSEVQWPFPMDEWGKGKAFRCKAADCGAEVNVYIRAKIGFCNCTTGVSDDDELARLSDFNLMGDKPVVLAPGHPIAVAWMKAVAGPTLSPTHFNQGDPRFPLRSTTTATPSSPRWWSRTTSPPRSSPV
jgi:hypothetical protein